MAETYTDSTGKVFPLNAYGRPQGYWDGNKFVFPKFGNQPAAMQPVADPVVQPTTPYRLPSSVQQQQQEGDAAGGDPTQLGGGPQGGAFATNNQTNPSVTASQNPSSGSLFGGASNLTNLSISPAVAQSLGGRVGSMTGIPGAGLLGSIAGGLAGGRGGRGIGGDVAGTILGNLAVPVLGGLVGGVVGGRIGDMKDMEAALALGPRGQRGFFSSLGHGFGLGPSTIQQLQDYYGINQPGIDPFGAGAQGGFPGLADEDDIGDIDPASNDPFGDIADALIGDMFGGPGDTQGDTTADDGVGFDV